MSKNFSQASQCPPVDTLNEYFRDERKEAIQAVRNFTQGHIKKDGIGKTVSGNGSKIVNLQKVLISQLKDAKISFQCSMFF